MSEFLDKLIGIFPTLRSMQIEQYRMMFYYNSFPYVADAEDGTIVDAPEDKVEDISSGSISQKGLYDKINIGDYVIPVVEVTPPEEESLEAEEKETSVVVKEPALLQLLRNIQN